MSRLHLRILLGLVIVGAVLRTEYFEADTSLWGDEAMLAANLAGRSYGELASPLDQDQHAPYGFLVVEKVIFDTFGLNELWLRSPPFVSSVLALLAFPWVASFFLSPRAMLFATATFAL